MKAIHATAVAALATAAALAPAAVAAQAADAWQFDAALSREFRVREGQRLEIRAEAFNIINGVRPVTPTAGSATLNINSPNTFGVILSSYDPRIMQFAAKFVF